jgi:uncharacterized membrane protein
VSAGLHSCSCATAAAAAGSLPSLQVLDPNLQQDFELLQAFKASESADLTIESRSTDNTTWLVSFLRDNGPVEYYLYDRSLFRWEAGTGHIVVLSAPLQFSQWTWVGS